MYFELFTKKDLSNQCCICQDLDLNSLEYFTLKELLIEPNMYGLFLKNDQGKNIGEALFRILKDKTLYLELLCTLSTGQGHGSLIIKQLISFAKENNLNQIELISTDEAEAFYLRHHFVKILNDREKDYVYFVLKI